MGEDREGITTSLFPFDPELQVEPWPMDDSIHTSLELGRASALVPPDRTYRKKLLSHHLSRLPVSVCVLCLYLCLCCEAGSYEVQSRKGRFLRTVVGSSGFRFGSHAMSLLPLYLSAGTYTEGSTTASPDR